MWQRRSKSFQFCEQVNVTLDAPARVHMALANAGAD